MLETGKRANLEIQNAFSGKEIPHLDKTNSPYPGGQQLSVRRAPVTSISSLLAENDTAQGLLLVWQGSKALDS